MQIFSFFSLALLVAIGGMPCAFSSQPDAAASAPEFAAAPIALLLPLKSPSFARAAEAVKQGFLAAANLQGSGGIEVKVYAAPEEPADILTAYQQAVDEGARIVVGPLTRDGVSALAASGLVRVPTLALNIVESSSVPPANLYLFGLQAEAEARQTAQLAATENRRRAITISDSTPLSKRIQQAFTEEWKRLGGSIAEQIPFKDDMDALLKLRQDIVDDGETILFLALDAPRARMLRPYLDPAVPTFATSQVFPGKEDTLGNFDLNGIRFVDMPWLLQPDHAAVMVYPRPEGSLSVDLERLYALGIDAFRLAQELLRSEVSGNFTLDGVTGQITLSQNHQFTREPTPAVFHQGEAQPLGNPTQ